MSAMFNSGRLKILQKIPGRTETGESNTKLNPFTEVWYGDISVGIKEQYIVLQADTAIDRRVRVRQDRRINDKFALEIKGVQYDVIRVWHGFEKGIPITDITLAAITENCGVNV